jgi:hypothetical protein
MATTEMSHPNLNITKHHPIGTNQIETTRIESPGPTATIRIEQWSGQRFLAEIEDIEAWEISKDEGDDYTAEECDWVGSLPIGYGGTESEALEALLHSIPLYLQWLQGKVNEITPVIEARIKQLEAQR